MTALIHGIRRQMAAEANWGQWVVRCAWCPSARSLKPGTSAYRCRECDCVTEAIWPPDDMVQGVERLLMMRPDVTTRNWLPGETLIDLMLENGQHGILTGVEGSLVVEDGRIRKDTLPSTRPLKAITQ